MFTAKLIRKGTVVLFAITIVLSLVGCNLPSEKSSSPNSTDQQTTNDPAAENSLNSINEPTESSKVETTFPPKEWLFSIHQPKKEIGVTENEIALVEKIEVSHLLAGKVYEYTFSSSEEISAVLSWYKSLELETATFSVEEQEPNMKEGDMESYIIYHKDDTKKEFWYYSGDEFIYTDDIWYEIVN